jgi:RES domain-containing protein
MLTGKALDDALIGRVKTRPGSDPHCRAVPVAWAFDPLGRGRPIADMRFNRSGGARVLYLGENPTVCVQEAQAVGFPAQGILCIPVEVRLEAILDLGDAATRRELQLKLTDVQLNFRGLNKNGTVADTQTLGERCSALKVVDGIRYPSAAHKGGWCLAVIESNLRIGKAELTVRFQLDANGTPIPFPVPAGRVGPPNGLPSGIWDRLP